MAGRAKSQTKRQKEASDEMEKLIQAAVTRYKSRTPRTIGGKKKPQGLRKVCEDISNEYAKSTGRRVNICHTTVSRRINGRRARTEAHEDEAHLTTAERKIVVASAIELSKRNIPFSHRRLKEHIDEVVRRRNPEFPGVGKLYTHRFVEKEPELAMHWSRPLDNRRGGAVNRTTHAAWFSLLERVLLKYEINNDMIYGADETGIQPGEGERRRVIGLAGKSVQHQKRSGGRETITVLVTICADGTTIPPTVLFRGKHYLVRWIQDNPLDALIGHSQKGWITGEIAVAWLKNFDAVTKEKAAGRYRLLLLDGHASHLSLPFLNYAYSHDIVVLCYPSHSTHVFQGLDKVCFGTFKEAWSDRRDEYEMETGVVIQKHNFIRVMGAAFVKAFTPKNIKSAFLHTGVVPFNPSAISPDTLAPSIETSNTSSLPLRQPSPIQGIVDAILENGSPSSSRVQTPHRIQSALESTSAQYLVSDSPIEADHPDLPLPNRMVLPPISHGVRVLLGCQPKTDLEVKLHQALQELVERDERREGMARAADATLVLQGLYCARLKQQMMAKKDENKESGRLLGDGLPVLLTDDAFRAEAAERAKKRERKEQGRAAKKRANFEYKAAVEEWKREREIRIEKNKATEEEWRAEVERWEIERDLAKQENRRRGWLKPAKPTKLRLPPKPTRRSVELENMDSDSNSSESESEGEDMSGSESDD